MIPDSEGSLGKDSTVFSMSDSSIGTTTHLSFIAGICELFSENIFMKRRTLDINASSR